MSKPQADKAPATMRLRLRAPVLAVAPDDRKAAWAYLNDILRHVSVGIQNGLADVLVHLRATGQGGQKRLATPTEREAGVDPTVRYTKDDLSRIQQLLSEALQRAGVTEYVYSTVSSRLAAAEFTGSKLTRLIRGEIAYPVVRHPAIEIRSREWCVTVVEEKGKDGKTRVRPVVEIPALRKGCGKMTLVCDSLHGRGAAGMLEILEQLQVLGKQTSSEETGWAKHALILKPMGPEREWHLLLPYTAPRVVRDIDPDAVVAIHRGMANFLTAVVVRDGKVRAHYYSGSDIVAAKSQFLARGSAIRKAIAGKENACRGRKARYHAKDMLSDKQHRVVGTAIWRAARWAQRIVEENSVGVAVVENFGTIRSDVATDAGRYLEPYIRRFPFYTTKLRVKDALQRRAGTVVEEVKAEYISRTCPACGHESAGNIVRLPRVRSPRDVESGSFKCEACGLPGNLDFIAALNMLVRADKCPESVLEALRRFAKIMARERHLARDEENIEQEGVSQSGL